MATLISKDSSINFIYSSSEPYLKDGEEVLYFSDIVSGNIRGDEYYCNKIIFELLDEAVLSSGINLIEVKKSVSNLTCSELLSLGEVPLYFSLDMVISEYVFERPLCFMESLLYGSGKGFLNTKQGGGDYDEEWFFVFVRVALYREFVDIIKYSVFSLDRSERSPFEKKENFNFFAKNTHGSEVELEGNREFYSISKPELISKFYRERVRYVMSGKVEDEVSPPDFFSSIDFHNFYSLLSHAAKDHDLFVFKSNIKDKAMRADKVFSICSGLYVYMFKKLVYTDTPLVGEHDENEDDSVSKRISELLEKKYMVELKPRTIYRAYLEGNKIYFSKIYDMWGDFLVNQSLKDMSCWQILQIKVSNCEFIK